MITTVDLVVALDAPLELDVGREELAHGGIGQISLDGGHVGPVSGTDGSAPGERRIEDGEQRVLRTIEMLGLDGGILGLAADFGDQVAGSLGFGGLLGRNGACSSGFGHDAAQIFIGRNQRGQHLAGIVGSPEFERRSALQQVADALRLLDARQLDENAVRIGQTHDVGLRDAEVVDTAAQDVERSGDGSLGLMLEDFLDIGVGRLQRDVLAVGADEDDGQRTAVGLTLVSLDEIGDVILGIALLQRLVGLGDRCGESGIGLAVAGQRLDDIFDLHFEHDIHAALEVETQIQLFLLTLLVSELAETYVEDGQILHRIQEMLFSPGSLLQGELRRISDSLLLDVTRLERKRELVNACERQERSDEFDETFTLHWY